MIHTLLQKHWRCPDGNFHGVYQEKTRVVSQCMPGDGTCRDDTGDGEIHGYCAIRSGWIAEH